MKEVKEANTVFLLVVVFSVSLSGVVGILASFGIDFFGGSYALQVLVSQVVFVLPILLYLIFCSKSITILRFKKIGFVNILLCVLLYICLSPVLTFINLTSQLYSSNLISSVMFSVGDEMPFPVGLFLIAILPAFCEECSYRGFFYNTYREHSPLGAVLVSGLIFGLLHGNLNQFSYATVLGMCFAMIVEATDSIWSTIVVHFLVNASSCCIIYLLPKGIVYLQELFAMAQAEGDTMTMDMIKQLLGTDEISIDSIMGTANTALSKADILRSIPAYIVPALIGATLAFFLYRCIAVRCGRWEHIKSLFRHKPETLGQPAIQPDLQNGTSVETAQDSYVQMTTNNGSVATVSLIPAKVKIFTWQLIAAIVILVIDIASTEIILRLGA